MHSENDALSIRLATMADLTAVKEIEVSCFDETERFSSRVLAYLISKSKGGTYLAVIQGQPVGYLSILQRRGCRHLRIYSVAVSPSQSGKGIGSRMMDFAIQEAKRRGLLGLSLEVYTQNESALALYTKYGFVKRRVLHDYYAPKMDAYYMTKTI